MDVFAYEADVRLRLKIYKNFIVQSTLFLFLSYLHIRWDTAYRTKG